MDIKNIQEMLNKELATKIINTLPDEQKNLIIAEAVQKVLLKDGFISDWEIRKILEKYALNFAHEYAQTDEVQRKLKEKAYEAVDDILEGIVKHIGKGIENEIKNKYSRILSDKKYGEY
jgi:uncharacterized membrane-anchored protein YjiN (DUF445 family)